jgi:hypothetical protein
MQQVGIIADTENDMLVPDLVQHGTAGLFHGSFSLFEECRRREPLTPFGTACIPSSCGAIKAQQVTPRLGPDAAGGTCKIGRAIAANGRTVRRVGASHLYVTLFGRDRK